MAPNGQRQKRIGWAVVTLALLLVIAVLATVTLGDVVGRGGGELFTYRVRSGDVWVESVSRRDNAEQVAAWADGYLTLLAARFGVAKPGAVIRLLDNETRYAAFGRQNLPGFGGAMQFCYARSDGAVYGWWCPSERLTPRLQHELFHRLAHRTMPRLPLWLEEGTAVLVETLQAKDGKLAVSGPLVKRLDQAARLLDEHGLDKLTTLLDSPQATFIGPQGFDLYSLSYATAAALDSQDRLQTALRVGVAPVDGQTVLTFVSRAR